MDSLTRDGQPHILVAGATGYVGQRLLERLLAPRPMVRVLVRKPKRLSPGVRGKRLEICQGDVLDEPSLKGALEGISIAYYLIHSMHAGEGFAARDRLAAANFGRAAKAAGVQRIIYLGGLGDSETDLSDHLRSRQETGDVLRRSGVPVTEFRAGIIVGSGSLSFEMIRNLTERIPLMICPRWVYQRTQPIAIDDVLDYLVAALEIQGSAGQILEIGGTEVLTYGDLMKGYALVRGLRRLLLPVPVLTPRLSSYWVHWTTPLPAVMARPLIEGLKSEVVVTNDDAKALFPNIQRRDYATAVRQALEDLRPEAFDEVLTAKTGSLPTSEPTVQSLLDRGMIIETWQVEVNADPKTVYNAFASLGGERGWRPCHGLWVLRATLDRLIGGVGMRKGRPPVQELKVGDTIDFYRVEEVKSNHRLRLHVEMKLPGAGWLQFEACPAKHQTSLLKLSPSCARLRPRRKTHRRDNSDLKPYCRADAQRMPLFSAAQCPSPGRCLAEHSFNLSTGKE
jgi:uncharacterized protein YbjT (DUF2867 family)